MTFLSRLWACCRCCWQSQSGSSPPRPKSWSLPSRGSEGGPSSLRVSPKQGSLRRKCNCTPIHGCPGFPSGSDWTAQCCATCLQGGPSSGSFWSSPPRRETAQPLGPLTTAQKHHVNHWFSINTRESIRRFSLPSGGGLWFGPEWF